MGQGKGKKPATYEDIEALPVGWVGEIIEDELYAFPRPASPHLRVASRLGALLAMRFEMAQGGPGGWWFFDEPELHFGRNVVVPDLAGWRRERVPEPPNAPWLTIAPDWLCEVLSPSTWSVDVQRKMPLYHREGVEHAWIIDPAQRTLEIYRRGTYGWIRAELYGGDDIVRVEPFDAIPLDLGLLWLPEARRGREGPPAP
ncbi:Uma2 family endonuclease [Myxococcus sp. RHSTA-1-4]|uniref:Uma2 family endonuclease n=1 Tax=Myxococcus sp. RHSTA-1-4 TaxID=2874601 RepID=UPI001CC1575E|nr:Uma2 family endonuclease [Myxococcus sp. RHSTA-1-4]MBZ4417322.1 Uma2 family endonuclease [Myxococcus sp. RHSTA-1-4]